MEDKLVNDEGCPQCGSLFVHPVKWTWWGGVIGPKLFKHTKCTDCKFAYNEKTRQSNKKNIILFLSGSAAIGLIIGIAYAVLTKK